MALLFLGPRYYNLSQSHLHGPADTTQRKTR